MYEEIFHRIILENVPNIFRIKSSLEAFIKKEIEENNLPKIKSIRLARKFDNGDFTDGQIILFNSEDHQKIAQHMNGKEFMGNKLKTRVYTIVNICEENHVTISFKLNPSNSKPLEKNESKRKDRK